MTADRPEPPTHRQERRPTRRAVVGRAVAAPLALAAGAHRAAPSAEAAPQLRVRPTEVLAGVAVTVDGSGFPARAKGRLIWAETDTSLGSFTADDKGRFRTSVTTPPDIPAAKSYRITATSAGRTIRGTVSIAVPSGAPVALGAFIPGAPRNTERVDAFATRTGHQPAIVMWYQHWGLPDTREFDPKLLTNASAHRATPMVTWEPWDPREGRGQDNFGLAAIRNGKFDDYIRLWAAGLKAFGDRVYLRFAHEMNGTWYPWCVGQNGNTAADYVRAWNHLRQVFDEEKADNVLWVWSPNVSYNGSAPLDNVLYPGDAFVDWIGIDGYNWGTQTDDHRWQSFAKVFGPTLAEIDAIAPAKPVMIAETASAEEGGDKAAWIRSALLRDLPLRYPKVRALVWFDEEKERDWTVDSSEATLREFRAAAAHPYYDSPPTDQRVSATRRGGSDRRRGTDEDRRRRQGSGQRGRRDRRQA